MDEKEFYSETLKVSLSFVTEQAKDFYAFLRGRKRVKKNSKERIGLIFAIATHNVAEHERLRSDLIKPLKHALESASSKDTFNVIELPSEEAAKIETPKDALGYLAKKRAHMMIYGDLMLRNMGGEDQHVFRLNGAVRHTPINKQISNRFSANFRDVLPELSWFPVKNEIGSFEVKKLEIVYVIKYVIGVAAALSLDLALGRKLLEDLLIELSTIPDVEMTEPFGKFYILTRQRLAEVLSTYLVIAYARFNKFRDKNEILAMGTELDALKELDPDNYRIRLTRAIFLFFSNRVNDAIAELSNVQNSDVMWRYSLGFLYAYSNKIDEALEQYRKTHYHPVTDNGTLLDIEVFISEVIEKEPEKIQLLFFRGLINHKQKGDIQLAKEDFENFIAKSNSQFPQLEELAKKYLSGMSVA